MIIQFQGPVADYYKVTKLKRDKAQTKTLSYKDNNIEKL